jgi:hypothetical protein
MPAARSLARGDRCGILSPKFREASMQGFSDWINVGTFVRSGEATLVEASRGRNGTTRLSMRLYRFRKETGAGKKRVD